MSDDSLLHAPGFTFRPLAAVLLVLLGCGAELKANPTRLTYDPTGNTLSQQSSALAAPTITGQPASLVAASPNFSAGFSVTVASPSPVTYQWYFNGTLIPGATGDSLLYNNPTLANEGLYTVTVTNTVGSVTSNPSRLVIDSNDNGLGDNWEQQYFGDLDQKATGDFDGDGLTNLKEFEDGTDPTIRAVIRWIAASGDFNNPANWSAGRVPVLHDSAVIETGSFTLPSNQIITATKVTITVPYESSAVANTTLVVTGKWNFMGPVVLANGRTFTVAGGGSVTINGLATLNGASLIAQDTNTKFTVNGLASYTQPNNTAVEWRAGEPNRSNDGCELNFPNLTTIIGGVTTQNTSYYFDLIGRTGGRLNLPALTAITVPAETASIGSSGVRLSGIDSGILSAPALSQFADATALSNSWVIVVLPRKSGRLERRGLLI